MNAQDVLTIHQNQFYGALLSGDLDTLAQLYSEDYKLVRSDGSILNKQQVLRDLEEGGLTFTSIMLCIEDVRVFETSAVIIGESHAIASRAGMITPMQFRLVAIYELMGVNLRLSYFQSTNLANGVSDWSQAQIAAPQLTIDKKQSAPLLAQPVVNGMPEATEFVLSSPVYSGRATP